MRLFALRSDMLIGPCLTSPPFRYPWQTDSRSRDVGSKLLRSLFLVILESYALIAHRGPLYLSKPGLLPPSAITKILLALRQEKLPTPCAPTQSENPTRPDIDDDIIHSSDFRLTSNHIIKHPCSNTLSWIGPSTFFSGSIGMYMSATYPYIWRHRDRGR
jgi:hypothetical protein